MRATCPPRKGVLNGLGSCAVSGQYQSTYADGIQHVFMSVCGEAMIPHE